MTDKSSPTDSPETSGANRQGPSETEKVLRPTTPHEIPLQTPPLDGFLQAPSTEPAPRKSLGRLPKAILAVTLFLLLIVGLLI